MNTANTVLSTQRLVLGPIRATDAPCVNAWRNDPEIQRLSADDLVSESLEHTQHRVQRWVDSDPNEGIYFGIRTSADELIGLCIVAIIEKRHRRCRLGILLGEKRLWGNGYGTEACSAVLGYCFENLDLNRVGAEAYAINPRSIRMLEGLGFVREGVLRQSVWKPEAVDEYVYGLLRHEWLNGAGRHALPSGRA